MSSVRFKSSSEEKMSMYENMVEDLVGDENSRYILDGKWNGGEKPNKLLSYRVLNKLKIRISDVTL